MAEIEQCRNQSDISKLNIKKIRGSPLSGLAVIRKQNFAYFFYLVHTIRGYALYIKQKVRKV